MGLQPARLSLQKKLRLGSSQRKSIIRGFRQTQSHEPLFDAIVDLRPKRPDNIFAGRRDISKIVCLQIEMSILPRLKRFFDGFSKRNKIIKRSTPFVVLTANRCLRQITMTMAERIIALAIELRVLGVRKSNGMETMRSMKGNPHPEENAVVAPSLRKKIFALVQTEQVLRHRGFYALINISR